MGAFLKFSEAALGRVFVLRLEEREALNATLEAFASEHGLSRALAFYVGGAMSGSKVVVGPDADCADSIIPLIYALAGSQEALAVGTIFPNEAGEPVLHMHTASGREGGATVGCTRAGMQTWLVGEVILLEILGTQALRRTDPDTGFGLLDAVG
jgi:uncharacterized protein